MESNPDDLLVLTIVIQMHGKVINFDLTPRETNIFNNVRLFCKVGDFIDYETTPINELILISALKNYFTNDLPGTTYDILKKAQYGVLVNNITYDKALSISEPTILDTINPMTYIEGVYLLSIHEGGKLVYPKKDDKNTVINLLKLTDLHSLAKIFHTEVPNITDLSTVIPSQNIYIEQENAINHDNTLTKKEKEEMVKQIRNQFYNNLYNWQLTLERNKIISIKLTTLVELVKIIIGKPCFINLLDYSCNSPTKYIPEKQKTLKQYGLQEGDIEMGITNTSYGGKKNQKKGTKSKYKNKKNKGKNGKTRKNRKYIKKLLS